MINIDFSPNSIEYAFKSNEEIIDNADSIEKLDLPEHEDISSELIRAKKDIDSFSQDIGGAAKNIKSELSSILDKDFEYKFNLFVQLLSKGLTEESFPMNEWIEEKEKLNENFNNSHFSFLKSSTKNCENQEIKDLLIYEYLSIQKHCLNSNKSFKYMSGSGFIKDLNEFMIENALEETFINQKLKTETYDKINGIEYKSSQAYYWKVYSCLKNIDKNQHQVTSLLLDIKQEETKEFVSFLGKTDFFIKRNYKDFIEGFKKEPLRELVCLLENEQLRTKFFPEFLIQLENFKEKISLKKEDKEMFDSVIKELDKTNQYLTLSNKLDKKLEKSKTIKI